MRKPRNNWLAQWFFCNHHRRRRAIFKWYASKAYPMIPRVESKCTQPEYSSDEDSIQNASQLYSPLFFAIHLKLSICRPFNLVSTKSDYSTLAYLQLILLQSHRFVFCHVLSHVQDIKGLSVDLTFSYWTKQKGLQYIYSQKSNIS